MEAYKRLHDFASRYAAPGATVAVYCLHDSEDRVRPAAQFSKSASALFQPPNCYGPNTNGVKLSAFVEVPIEQSQLTPSCLDAWDQAVLDIKQHLNPAAADAAEEEVRVNCGFSAARTGAKGVAVR